MYKFYNNVTEDFMVLTAQDCNYPLSKLKSKQVLFNVVLFHIFLLVSSFIFH